MSRRQLGRLLGPFGAINGNRPHSIIWSARPSSVGGTSRPSALAVLRLITNSNLVDCVTRKSAGFSSLRMRPVSRLVLVRPDQYVARTGDSQRDHRHWEAVQAARPSRFGPDEHTLRLLRVCARDRVRAFPHMVADFSLPTLTCQAPTAETSNLAEPRP
jgi:hypothetical protein